jgi:hypothetical protein
VRHRRRHARRVGAVPVSRRRTGRPRHLCPAPPAARAVGHRRRGGHGMARGIDPRPARRCAAADRAGRGAARAGPALPHRSGRAPRR